MAELDRLGAREAELVTGIEEIRREARSPGFAVGVAQSGEMTFFHGFGQRDVEQGLPITAETLFGLGSVTKSFTCIAVMQLQEAGKLRVEDPVVRYLPEFRTPDPEATGRMTVHHFMTHTSGLPGLPFVMSALQPQILADPDTADTEWRVQMKALDGVPPIRSFADLFEALASYPYRLLTPPGQAMNYSNEDYALLGLLIERVSGQPYSEYITRHILEPAGMTRTSLGPKGLTDGNVATLYDARERNGEKEVFPSPAWWPAPVYLSAGSLTLSCVRDMLRYAEIFRNGGRVGDARILSEDSVRAMTTAHTVMPPYMHYGYGLAIQQDFHGVRMIEHGGSIKGVAAQFLVVPERGLSVVVLSNLTGNPSERVAVTAATAALGLPLDAPRFPRTEYTCSPEELALYVGTYGSEEDADHWVVTAAGDHLEVRSGEMVAAALPVAPHTFSVKFGASEFPGTFRVGLDGQVEGVFFHIRFLPRLSGPDR